MQQQITQRFIGIDPGTRCGYGVLDRDGSRVVSGVWDLAPRRHEGAGMRFVRFARMFAELLDAFPGAQLAYEEVSRHKGTAAAHIYGGIVAQVQRACEEKGCPYVGIPVGTVKKNATGTGNANKDAMVAASKLRWPWPSTVDHNEADACWVADALLKGLA